MIICHTPQLNTVKAFKTCDSVFFFSCDVILTEDEAKQDPWDTWDRFACICISNNCMCVSVVRGPFFSFLL